MSTAYQELVMQEELTPHTLDRGTRFLDTHFGIEWPLTIPVDRLDMLDPQGCVLALVSGMHYANAILAHNLNDIEDGVRLGFFIRSIDYLDWDKLTQAWHDKTMRLRKSPRRIEKYNQE